MRPRTKLKLKFYMSVIGLLLFTIVIGVFFQYVMYYAWQIQLGTPTVKYEVFLVMAVILFIMCITDIILFFQLILRRKYW